MIEPRFSGSIFTVEQRGAVRERLLEKAYSDSRIVAAAAIGSSATGGDRWSDLDLTFGVANDVPLQDVLDDWTNTMVADLDAVVLFDLPFRSTIYRVFLLPGALQVDLSFAPVSAFGSHGPRFELLFGEAIEHSPPPPPSSEHMFGLAIHHCVRAHVCIERGRLWQAEYWIHEARDEALALACRRMELSESHGRGFDDLPVDARSVFEQTLLTCLREEDLRRVLRTLIGILLTEVLAEGVPRAAEVRAILNPILHVAADGAK